MFVPAALFLVNALVNHRRYKRTSHNDTHYYTSKGAVLVFVGTTFTASKTNSLAISSSN